MNRFRVKSIPPNVHVVALWAAILVTLATTLVALVIVLNVLGKEGSDLRLLSCKAEAAELQSKQTTPLERREIIRFWTPILKDLHLRPCSIPPPRSHA